MLAAAVGLLPLPRVACWFTVCRLPLWRVLAPFVLRGLARARVSVVVFDVLSHHVPYRLSFSVTDSAVAMSGVRSTAPMQLSQQAQSQQFQQQQQPAAMQLSATPMSLSRTLDSVSASNGGASGSGMGFGARIGSAFGAVAAVPSALVASLASMMGRGASSNSGSGSSGAAAMDSSPQKQPPQHGQSAFAMQMQQARERDHPQPAQSQPAMARSVSDLGSVGGGGALGPTEWLSVMAAFWLLLLSTAWHAFLQVLHQLF